MRTYIPKQPIHLYRNEVEVLKKIREGSRMVNIRSFVSAFIKADEVKDGEIIVFLDEGELADGKYGKQLNIRVNYKSEERLFTIKKTNADKLSEAFGEETKNWVGKGAKLTVERVKVMGEMVDTITLDPIIKNGAEKKLPKSLKCQECDEVYTESNEIATVLKRGCLNCKAVVK